MVRIVDAEGARVSTPDEYRRELDRAAKAAEDAARDQTSGVGRAQDAAADQAVNQASTAEAPTGPEAAWASGAPGWPSAGGDTPPSYGDVLPAPGYGAEPYAYGYPGQPYATTAYGPGYAMVRDAATPDELSLPLRGATWGQAITRFFKNYAVFDGRASQSEFLWMVLTQGLFLVALEGLLLLIGVSTGSFEEGVPASPLIMIVPITLVAYLVGTFVPWLALSWRRLHDTDLSGALWFLTFIPYLGSLVVFILCCLGPKPRGVRFDAPNRYARY